jgi:hypothetical protein
LHPLRQFIYGLALCFLAALLAVEAKAAWAANNQSPNDVSAAKLCPAAGKQVDCATADGAHSSAPPMQLAKIGMELKGSAFPERDRSRPDAFEAPRRFTELSFFSATLFLRPPPAL